MANTNTGRRANRTAIATQDNGRMVATFYKTHDKVGEIQETGFTPSKEDLTTTAKREEFRQWAIGQASKHGIDWKPELQEQAWARKYWKYETDSQVEEDAIELLGWTIRKTCKGIGYEVEDIEIALDSIVANKSSLSYVENGKYLKNGNWAEAQVNLEVSMKIQGTEIQIIWAIEMRSGQLKKVKLTKAEVDEMVKESGLVAM